MGFWYRYKLLLQTISFVILFIPSGVVGIIYLYEKIRGVELTMVSIPILWFILPPPIIGIVLLIIIAIQGHRPMEIFWTNRMINTRNYSGYHFALSLHNTKFYCIN